MEQELTSSNGSTVILKPDETVETRIALEVSKFSYRDAKIQELKEQYNDLAIAGVDDKEGYEAVRVALGIVKSVRTGFENKRKELKADYLKIGTAIDAEAKRLTLLIKPLEDKLQTAKDKIDDEKEAAKKKKELEEQQKLNTRINELIAAGMKFDGQMYSIGDTISVDVVTVKNMADDKYDNLRELVTKAKEKLDKEEEDRKAEAKRKQEEFEAEQKKLKDQQAEQQRKQKELEDKEKELKQKEEELKKQAEEAEKEKERARQKERFDNVIKAMETTGMTFYPSRNQWYFKNDIGTLLVNQEELMSAEPEVLQQRAAEMKKQIHDWTSKQTEKDNEERQKRQQREKEEEEQKEKDRVAKLGDMEKLKEYADALLAVRAPEPFKSGEMATRYSNFKSGLTQMLKNLTA